MPLLLNLLSISWFSPKLAATLTPNLTYVSFKSIQNIYIFDIPVRFLPNYKPFNIIPLPFAFRASFPSLSRFSTSTPHLCPYKNPLMCCPIFCYLNMPPTYFLLLCLLPCCICAWKSLASTNHTTSTLTYHPALSSPHWVTKPPISPLTPFFIVFFTTLK